MLTASRVVVGYVGGVRPSICVIEVAWSLGVQKPAYLVRSSRPKGLKGIRDLALDPRIRRDDLLPALVAATDEIEAEAIGDMGYDVSWVHPVNGPGTGLDAQMAVPVSEIESVVRILAEDKRLRFPPGLAALGRRAGGEVTVTDQEVLALGVACWYAFLRDERLAAEVSVMRPNRDGAEDLWETEHSELMPWEALMEG